MWDSEKTVARVVRTGKGLAATQPPHHISHVEACLFLEIKLTDLLIVYRRLGSGNEYVTY